ncbi:T9SS type A sorting domain-containing protein [Hymenobacter sp. ASUV-10]|uniref:T9SS type A sorting domain-containing protein n=1 Tax=Hymenobacter aranciens TaxID=3063996 RepID=A0ABT9BFV6_9BACT|nr:T9SS type A sorting domain-containing protein [Hymenobacter sp. ASUV-10]MDO7875398.1 T9SS type A sorting domain-containing protein [Hymenobacter sp. ASUV-10]
MKAIYLTLIAAGLFAMPARGQTVHLAGAAYVAVNWQPVATSDSIRFDLDQDGISDLTFADRNYYPTGGSQPTRLLFTMRTLSAGTELATDTSEFDSAHRFAALAPIGRGLRWQRGSTYLAYVLTGNGGTGGRGFFRNGVTDYVVVRKQIAGAWKYWWFNISGRSGSVLSRVNFYGVSQTALSLANSPSPQADALQVYPNPATTGWQLSGTGRYEVFDGTGRQVCAGTVPAATTISSTGLPVGLYQLYFYPVAGGRIQRVLVRQ